jgi:hypothetical protein
MVIKGEEKMSDKYYIYEISTRKVVEIIDVDLEDCPEDCPTDGLEYDWEQYGGTWDPEGLILDSCGADAENAPEEELTELEGDTLWLQD